MNKNKKSFVIGDGNYAASHIAYMFSEIACIYPITPSSPMAENVDTWAAQGKVNLFGQAVHLAEMQSEGGAAGALHGALQSGALATTFTASQGLLLMLPNMYKMAGELLPAVLHVSARTIATHALSIFGDHSDVYAARQTGFAMLAEGSVQEVMDLSAVAHLTAIQSRVPFLNFFDGFRTSHEIQKIEPLEKEDLIPLLDQEALKAFRERALNPEHPVTRGTAQNPDIFFQAREAANSFYDAVPDKVAKYMEAISKLTGRDYKPFNYYGASDAENIIVAMGSVTECIKEVIDYKLKNGEKVGLISVHLYRPFSLKYFFNVLPKSVKKISVLDRTKEPGANGDPLYLDVCQAFTEFENAPQITAGRYGLGSKDVTPGQILSVYTNLEQLEPKNHFTIGITDDVSYNSLPESPPIKVSPNDLYAAKFYGVGSDGTVGANKNSITIIGEATDKYCQAYFAYDSKKSGGFTASNLRFGNSPIRSTYLVNSPDFVACHVSSYIYKYDILKGLKPGGVFLLNSVWDAEETAKRLPGEMKRYLAENEIRFCIINATQLGIEIGLGKRTNTIMQSAFFKVSNVIPYDLAVKEMKNAIVKSYGKKGEKIVQMNYAAVEAGGKNIVEVNVLESWKTLEGSSKTEGSERPKFIEEICDPINRQEGDALPVSAFKGREDGTFPPGNAAWEKRSVAVHVPEWKAENCIQCNQCAYVCPHACIRPFLMDAEEAKAAPKKMESLEAKGKGLEGLKYRIQVAIEDCTGCLNCVEVCPAKDKALEMQPFDGLEDEVVNWNYLFEKVRTKSERFMPTANVKSSQFAQPLFEFSGACAGCGETPYIKLITQLFGEQMIMANATGCSSIYGASAPSTPYTINQSSGCGPAWGNSLFEDNAEYGFGIAMGVTNKRDRIQILMMHAIGSGVLPEKIQNCFKEWIEAKDLTEGTKDRAQKVLVAIKNREEGWATEIKKLKHYLQKKSIWVVGGDGWAYDIGFGGLDHVLASGENVNVLVLDTEVYSNTGGQSSKATPTGALAKFASKGKKVRKKDLGLMATSYGYVYVAQISMGANQNQCLKAIREAESYDGPSLIIAYSPCIEHGIKGGLTRTQEEAGRAVKCGYWNLYRFDPRLEKAGKNPFQLDSKKPDFDLFQDFLNQEVRYKALRKSFPEKAEALFLETQQDAMRRHQIYEHQAQYEPS